MLPVTAAAVSEKDTEINLTAKHKGEAGNFIDIRLNYYDGETTAPGLELTFTQSTKGAGNASLADTIGRHRRFLCSRQSSVLILTPPISGC